MSEPSISSIMEKYQNGLNRGTFEDMANEEILALAMIGKHHIEERKNELIADEFRIRRDGHFAGQKEKPDKKTSSE